jgi:uncharacterized protein (DUF1778 family)
MAAPEERRIVRKRSRSDVTINVRATRQTRALIDTAAELVGKSRSEFILESARQKAEDVLLDQRLFALDDAKLAEFMAILDQPPAASEALRKLLLSKSPWQK